MSRSAKAAAAHEPIYWCQLGLLAQLGVMLNSQLHMEFVKKMPAWRQRQMRAVCTTCMRAWPCEASLTA
ncbi:hypothetical protein IPP92_03365 [Candidatus Saccharibacteria bacterium]|nr:MAG: hypothetical protein IPP92_03365 [Candidatus Saccharibacteria bacterium]